MHILGRRRRAAVDPAIKIYTDNVVTHLNAVVQMALMSTPHRPNYINIHNDKIQQLRRRYKHHNQPTQMVTQTNVDSKYMHNKKPCQTLLLIQAYKNRQRMHKSKSAYILNQHYLKNTNTRTTFTTPITCQCTRCLRKQLYQHKRAIQVCDCMRTHIRNMCAYTVTDTELTRTLLTISARTSPTNRMQSIDGQRGADTTHPPQPTSRIPNLRLTQLIGRTHTHTHSQIYPRKKTGCLKTKVSPLLTRALCCTKLAPAREY